MEGLGMEDGKIPDSSITASSVYNSHYRPSNGRLYKFPYGWMTSQRNTQQWFQVNFGGWTQVTRFCTQGEASGSYWVTKYRLAYSYDGVFYRDYVEDNLSKVWLLLLLLLLLLFFFANLIQYNGYEGFLIIFNL